MSNSTLTPWFPADVKPVRTGFYRTRLLPSSYEGFSYFDGCQWGNQGKNITEAEEYWKDWRAGGAEQAKRWRGLAKKP